MRKENAKTLGRRRSRKTEAVKVDFLEAIDRLVDRKPKEAQNRALAKAGKLKINRSTVAREAGRTLRLLAGDRVHYSEILERIGDLKNPRKSPRKSPTAAAISFLEAEIREHVEAARRLWVETVELHASLIEREAELARYRPENTRLLCDLKQALAALSNLRAQKEGTNVIDIAPVGRTVEPTDSEEAIARLQKEIEARATCAGR
jgi:hypothetical protein